MANRVVLGAFDGTHVLRCSRPSQNVLNTGLTVNQLAFDSRWSELNNILQTGSFVSSTAVFDIPLPAGLTQPVIILVMISGSNQGVNEVNPMQTPCATAGYDLYLSQEQSETGTMLRFHIENHELGGTRRYTYTVLRNQFG